MGSTIIRPDISFSAKCFSRWESKSSFFMNQRKCNFTHVQPWHMKSLFPKLRGAFSTTFIHRKKLRSHIPTRWFSSRCIISPASLNPSLSLLRMVNQTQLSLSNLNMKESMHSFAFSHNSQSEQFGRSRNISGIMPLWLTNGSTCSPTCMSPRDKDIYQNLVRGLLQSAHTQNSMEPHDLWVR